MLTEAFYWILNMSIIGGITGSLILLLRKIRRLPGFFIYCLWIIPLIRLWLPFGISSKYSVMTLVSEFTTKTVYAFGPEGIPVTYTNAVMAAKNYFPVIYKTSTLESIFSISALVWAVIFAALIISMVFLYRFTKGEVKGALHVSENIYRMDGISTPAVYGIFKPRIIIPADMPDESLKYVLFHESVHLKRRDNLLRCVAVITACLHWFNPLSWVFLKYFFEDMEIACDAKVLKLLNKDEQNQYALALLNAAAGKTVPVSAFGGPRVKVRINKILSYKKLTLVSGICFSLLAAAIIIVLLTNAQI